MRSTIYALATAPGRAAVAVMRVSGPEAGRALETLAGDLPPPRQASLRRLRDDEGAVLDQALVLWMPGPTSFTGEDTAELHLHGGAAVIEVVSHVLGGLGLRLAEPGEFTRRAFEAGKLDLVEAEAVADLVDAETQAQRRQALDQLGGAVSAVHTRWRETLLQALAHLEAAVDFPDEDLPPEVAQRVVEPLRQLGEELRQAAGDRRGEHVRDGLRIALIGAPNAGKSSLLNALAGRDAAIVAASPGTTRDIVETRLVLAGVPTTLADTAGLRWTEEEVEREGVARARRWAETADLRVWVVDGSVDVLDAAVVADLLRGGDILALNKGDLPEQAAAAAARARAPGPIAAVSARLGLVAPLLCAVEAWAITAVSGAEPVSVTRQRHRSALLAAAECVDAALFVGAGTPELMAEDTRLAARELERLTGRIDPEDVLDRLFAGFCLGK